MSKIKLSLSTTGSALKATKPKSVKSLQKFLLRELKSHDFEHPLTCGVSRAYPKEVVAWCVDWMNTSIVKASYHLAEHGWDILVTVEKASEK